MRQHPRGERRMTQICVPIMVEEHASAIRDATLAAEHGADLVEFRIDVFFEDKEESTDLLQDRIDRVLDLVKGSPLPCIVTCRPHWEGGEYHGDDDERVSLYEALGTSDHPPAYIDVELATYTRSANIRQKINLGVNHPKQQRAVSTRLILSTHDFEGRPSDLTRKLLQMQDEPACSVIKIAYRARSIRDNLELFEILRDQTKPTIALGMGDFGIMSRILAPKFGGFLTFASLRDESTTAPGQITIEDLLGLYRFRSIKPSTKVYGIIGWPVKQSMSPLVHNAGFEQIGWDGVYVPMPVESSYESFKATVLSLIDHEDLDFMGASVTIPHKEHLVRLAAESPLRFMIKIFGESDRHAEAALHGAANTFFHDGYAWSHEGKSGWQSEGQYLYNTDITAILQLIPELFSELEHRQIVIIGAGGVARAAAAAALEHGSLVRITNRSHERAQQLQSELMTGRESTWEGLIEVLDTDQLSTSRADLYINCTPVGMTGGPDPDGLSIPIPDMPNLSPDTVFFDTVYNPIETPMLKAAKERGYRTIDGAAMFVKQAAAQFEIWTGQAAPEDLFDTLVREKLSE
ncbi:MAG: type I 3-dehydroquinate dehydratase [Phycisphaerae bacterium]|nr:type I 3-dehydroquinate dehydratase [Phycisphaerae bacterium]